MSYSPRHRLPLWTPGRGASGRWKQSPDDFSVVELPAREPEGEGEHQWLRIERRGYSTEEVASALAERAGVPRVAIGYAGLKDRQARTVQDFTVMGGQPVTQLPEGMILQKSSRSLHKLRVGELVGNRFDIRVRGCDLEILENRARKLEKTGMPNYYGEQRVGTDAPRRGYEALLGRGPFLSEPELKFALSAYQSLLFNDVLMRRGPRRLRGDLEEEGIPTGPIFGATMPWPSDEALQLEESVLLGEGLPQGVWTRFPRLTKGTRRKLWVELKIRIQPVEDGAWLRFGLPPGSYATVLLEELL